MTPLKLRESQYLLAWTVFFLCATVGGGIIGFIVGAIVGGILGAAGVSLQNITLITGALGFLISIPISYVCFRFAVAKFVVEKLNFQKDSSSAV